MNKPTPISKSINLGDGKSITIETGVLAKQAHGSVTVKQGNTVLLATVVSAKEIKPGVDFMPLSVDYTEKYAAFGRFPGGFRKREARPSDYEILISRLVDRALRPLFPKDYHAETFVSIELISAEKEVMPDALAGLAASAALIVSDIPFNGPISEVRVARVNGKLVINPTFQELEIADIDIMVGATKDNILMVEGEMDEVSEEEMLDAMKAAHAAIKIHCQAQIELSEMVGSTQKRDYPGDNSDEELQQLVHQQTYDKVYAVAASSNNNKTERSDAFSKVEEDFINSIGLTDEDEEKLTLVKNYFHDVVKSAVRNLILDEGIRLDGRKTDEIRPIWSEVDYLPTPHGSAVFTRGETQSLSTVTLGSKMDEQMIDSVLVKANDKFLLHYNFPPFSTGDARVRRGVGRREIGHGNLALRALKGMLPSETECPYTIRIVSDILESNGSSSMATVCAGTLALMDAGIKIKKPVSGIAMGLITDTKAGKWAVLSDILGDEDHLGDMDFKVTGTADGITACQMDIKVDGLSYEILAKALKQAKDGRMHILNEMLKTISEPRAEYKPHVPKMETIRVPDKFIGAIIGPGGKVIQGIQSDTNTVIAIEEKDGFGLVSITAPDTDSLNAAMQRVKEIIAVPEKGKIYKGKIKAIKDFGAFVEIMPGNEGLLHISEISHERIDKVDKYLKIGQMVDVKLIDIEKNGKLRLSMKVLIPKETEDNQ
ncbi:MAG: polyribonucleotide nucleotidyltransferase [Bacteroidales bacterium]|nr:polyribonucleotide nucleotidyltransferase [Bacteroidales bacterium]